MHFRPSDPEAATFEVVTGAKLIDLDTAPFGDRRTFTTKPQVQEASMFEAFARAARNMKQAPCTTGTTRDHRFYANPALITQAVLDAVRLSDTQGGIEVDLPDLELL